MLTRHCLQGDLIPWTVGQQMQDPDFPALSGVRIVRIAVHPDLPRVGYGSRAVELLRRYPHISGFHQLWSGHIRLAHITSGDSGFGTAKCQAAS